jgi:hypothetical protein
VFIGTLTALEKSVTQSDKIKLGVAAGVLAIAIVLIAWQLLGGPKKPDPTTAPTPTTAGSEPRGGARIAPGKKK